MESTYSRQCKAITMLCSTVSQTPFPIYTSEKTGPCYNMKKKKVIQYLLNCFRPLLMFHHLLSFFHFIDKATGSWNQESSPCVNLYAQ